MWLGLILLRVLLVFVQKLIHCTLKLIVNIVVLFIKIIATDFFKPSAWLFLLRSFASFTTFGFLFG